MLGEKIREAPPATITGQSETAPSPVPSLQNTNIVFTQPKVLPNFNGDLQSKHPVKFPEVMGHYFRKVQLSGERQLDLLSEWMEESASDWFFIYRPSWLSFDDFRRDFLHSYWSEVQQNHNILYVDDQLIKKGIIPW